MFQILIYESKYLPKVKNWFFKSWILSTSGWSTSVSADACAPLESCGVLGDIPPVTSDVLVPGGVWSSLVLSLSTCAVEKCDIALVGFFWPVIADTSAVATTVASLFDEYVLGSPSLCEEDTGDKVSELSRFSPIPEPDYNYKNNKTCLTDQETNNRASF